MCYYYSIGDLIELAKWYGAKYTQLTLFDSDNLMNGFSHPKMPVITSDFRETLSPMSWGLIPSWAKYDINKLRKSTLNARAETIFEKPSFKKSIIGKRCLVPASYFVEWQHKGSEKFPYKISVKDVPFFSFGGIYDEWNDFSTGELIQSFSIITTEANPLMAEIHNSKKRMPLILSRENEKKWLSSISRDEISSLLQPFPEENIKVERYTK